MAAVSGPWDFAALEKGERINAGVKKRDRRQAGLNIMGLNGVGGFVGFACP
jgi:hypothetical protein